MWGDTGDIEDMGDMRDVGGHKGHRGHNGHGRHVSNVTVTEHMGGHGRPEDTRNGDTLKPQGSGRTQGQVGDPGTCGGTWSACGT